MALSYERATMADGVAICHLVARFLEGTRYGRIIPYNPDQVASLVAAVLEVHGAAFIARNGDRLTGDKRGAVVGMLAYFVGPHPVSGEKLADELAWWVDPEHRTGTVGPRLLGMAETWAQQEGVKLLRMVAPVEADDVAQFYERMGYVAIETSFIKRLGA